MAKILICANLEETVYNFRLELVERLIAEQYNVILSFPIKENRERFKVLGCEIIEMKVSRHGMNPVTDLILLWNYVKLIKNLEPDIVLTYTIKPNIYASIAAALCQVPYINNVTGLGTAFHEKKYLSFLLLFMQKIAFRRSSCVFFQNRANQQLFREKNIVNGQDKLIPGSGVNLEVHQFEPYPPQESPIRFITIARLRKDKGYDELFSAIDKIKQITHGVEFHIVGRVESDCYKEQLNILESNGKLIYHGVLTREEVHELIADCHCAILPSYHEGMANVLLEAAAAGRPCLASDIPGCREIIDDGVTGFLFKPRDTKSLYDTIEKFLTLSYVKKSQMGIRGSNKMKAKFDRNIIVEEYLKKIKTVL